MKVIDLGQISYLRLKGYKFETQLDKEEKKVIFIFEEIKKEEAKNILKDYWNSDFYKLKLMIDSSRTIITNIKEKL